MTDLLRQEIATTAKQVVVKVGTRVLTASDGTLDQQQIADLAKDIHSLMEKNIRVVLVSSGAVGAGMSRLGIAKRPTDLAHLQAVAAVGQSQLTESYERTLRKYGCHAAQVLLTADDLNDRTRYLNARNTIATLLEYNVVPIINENDTVAVDELMTTFGDNDRLAAMVTNLIRAPLLIILSDVDGLYDGNPRHQESKVIPTVTDLDEKIFSFVQDQAPGLGKGGMRGKLEAVRIVTAAGENVLIARGRSPHVLARIMSGENIGTLFLAQGKSLKLRKRWIGFSAQPQGRLVLDDGAHHAIEKEGRSLLAIGIVSVEGCFNKGDIVSLCGGDGREFARGLTNYPQNELERIKGLKSDKIPHVLGHCPYNEVVHRDNMALTAS